MCRQSATSLGVINTEIQFWPREHLSLVGTELNETLFPTVVERIIRQPTSYSIWPPFLVCPIAYRTEATLGVAASDSSINCIEQTTEWSTCSKSCGMGFSTRVTNRNPQCEMVKQTRLCVVRPCEQEHMQPADKVRAWRQPPIPEEGALPHGRPGSRKSR